MPEEAQGTVGLSPQPSGNGVTSAVVSRQGMGRDVLPLTAGDTHGGPGELGLSQSNKGMSLSVKGE